MRFLLALLLLAATFGLAEARVAEKNLDCFCPEGSSMRNPETILADGPGGECVDANGVATRRIIGGWYMSRGHCACGAGAFPKLSSAASDTPLVFRCAPQQAIDCKGPGAEKSFAFADTPPAGRYCACNARIGTLRYIPVHTGGGVFRCVAGGHAGERGFEPGLVTRR